MPKQKTLQSRILKTNLVLVLIPMGVLMVIAIAQVSVLGQVIGQNGQAGIQAEITNELEVKAGDVGDTVKAMLVNVAADVNRCVTYERDLMTGAMNVTGTRASFYAGGPATPPNLAYNATYGQKVDLSYSDFGNSTLADASMNATINRSAYMDYVWGPILNSNFNTYVTIRLGFENHVSRVFPFVNNSRIAGDDVTVAPWYKAAKAANGNLIFNESYQSMLGPAILVAKAVKNSTGG